MRCHFCWDENETTRLTKEHLLSVPVARAFGIDRTGSGFARFDTDAVQSGDLGSLAWSGLDSLAVRIACSECNSGWMNDLEHAMVDIGKWHAKGDRPLGTQGLTTLRRWLLKTYVVLSVLDGGTRRFLPTTDEVEFSVVPEVTRASQLRRGAADAFDGVAVGLARTNSDNFSYGFGNPTVVPSGPHHANVRSAGVAALNLASLQLWIVVPWFRHAATRLPPGVAVGHSRLRAGRLQTVSARPNTLAPVVDNGEHDIVQLMADLKGWAEVEDSARRRDAAEDKERLDPIVSSPTALLTGP